MIYHLVTKYEDGEKVMLSFASSPVVFIEFEEYIYKMSKDQLKSITFNSDNLHTIKNTIKSTLDSFFKDEYVKPDFTFRPKDYRIYEYCGNEYDLNISSHQLRLISLYKLIKDVIKKRGHLLLHDESYYSK